jgi:hypothetical protein
LAAGRRQGSRCLALPGTAHLDRLDRFASGGLVCRRCRQREWPEGPRVLIRQKKRRISSDRQTDGETCMSSLQNANESRLFVCRMQLACPHFGRRFVKVQDGGRVAAIIGSHTGKLPPESALSRPWRPCSQPKCTADNNPSRPTARRRINNTTLPFEGSVQQQTVIPPK